MTQVPINHKVLTWARERNNLSLEELALALDISILKLKAFEDGTEKPPLTLLEKIAYAKLKIPLAVFFFPEPPILPDPVGKLRRLPDSEHQRLSPSTLAAIRLAQSYQDSLESLIGASQKNISDLQISKMGIAAAADHVRSTFQFSIEQQRKLRSPEKAFKALRHILEQWGIFTFKDSLEDKFISGFCLLSESFPVILINNSNSFTRQLFTLTHELAHILFGVNGITDINDSYIGEMSDYDRKIEIKCNQFASYFLIPESESEKIVKAYKQLGIDGIGEIANIYSVSREFILRRLLDIGQVQDTLYTAKAKEWNADYLRSAGNKPGGNYYLTHLSYLGETYTSAAFKKYKAGKISQGELASHLNVKPTNVFKLEGYLR